MTTGGSALTADGVWAAGEPSLVSSSSVLPKASASAWARRLAISRSCCSVSGLSGWQNPIRSQAISLVPWWISW